MGQGHAEGLGQADRDNAVNQSQGHHDPPGRPQTFLLTNIRGILSVGGKSKTGFLYDQAVNHNSLVVAVTETWLKPDMKDSELLVNFPGYWLLSI